jgi:hypothetical protein
LTDAISKGNGQYTASVVGISDFSIRLANVSGLFLVFTNDLNGIVLLQVEFVIRSVRQQRSRSRKKEKAKENWLPVAVTHGDECGMLDVGCRLDVCL